MQKELLKGCDSWAGFLNGCCKKDYFKALLSKLESVQLSGVSLVPSVPNIFKPLQITDFRKIRVIIVGQEPYPYQSTGIAFGVNPGTELPRALHNIVNEVESDMHYAYGSDNPGISFTIDRSNVTLEGWARQGVLLLNRVMTTEWGVNGAHYNIGWEQFVDDVIYALVNECKALVLWGSHAQKAEKTLSERLHGGAKPDMLILKASHPGPLGYNRGPLEGRFLGCRHFCKINEHLRELYVRRKETAPIQETIYKPINWCKTGEKL